MFTYKYKKQEFYISVEDCHGFTTYKTDYNNESIIKRYLYCSDAEAKKRFCQHLRDITDNPTKHNIFIEQ